ncbi:MarR family winged helix-turn-helix transcriptional regulator [Cohnella zeiphila]|uniref:MarR family transcriptional regulator n=1 Tax=Cohnella zeiphila TaxID=2761120 RepID=A0A7X0VX75_9BACL|nr:MarR family transcriptional regulator [Cohnella zeiphila]MBB6731648.1 MarR family transcriptional regulator [Cohnella zeiphila]
MSLDDSIGFLINQAGRRISQLLAQRFAPYEVTTEQWSVLARLREEDGISQKELAFRVGKDQTNVTRILDQLERKQLVVRRPNPDDRRSFLPYVTEEGNRVYLLLLPIEKDVVAEATSGIGSEDLAKLKELLVRVTDNSLQRLNL